MFKKLWSWICGDSREDHERIWSRLTELDEDSAAQAKRLMVIEQEIGIFKPPPKEDAHSDRRHTH